MVIKDINFHDLNTIDQCDQSCYDYHITENEKHAPALA